MPELRYHRPATVRDACLLGRRLGARGAFLAGGTELLPDHRRGREAAVELISLREFRELRGISIEDGALRIGSLTTVAEVARSEQVEAWSPAFAEAARALGSPQIRSRATVGGNFCRAVSCADLPPAALVGQGVLRIASVDGTRMLPVADFFLDARRTVLSPGELLLDITLPRLSDVDGATFERFALRRGLAVAVASVAARIAVKHGLIVDAAAALGAVNATPFLVPDIASMLEGQRPSPEAFALAAAACAAAARPISDIRGSADFRRDIVRVLARRAFERATTRAASRAVA